MKKVLIFSGTTEGRDFAVKLAAAGIRSVVCVATEYGELVMQETDHEKIIVHQGRMQEGEMVSFFEQNSFDAVVDATHPYAVVVSANIKNAVEKFEKISQASLPYYRLNREAEANTCKENSADCKRVSGGEENNRIHYFFDMKECAAYLEKKAGNILLTTGSKELKKFAEDISEPNRIYARVLPGKESLQLCEEAGIAGKQIIAMQGPFSVELNAALIQQFQIAYLVTKESGRTGGQEEKLQAAQQTGVEVCVIAKPEQIPGYSEDELLEIFGVRSSIENKMELREIALVGIGMGNPDTLTKEAERAIEEAEILFGAKRILEAAGGFEKPMESFYRAKDVLQYLKEKKKFRKAAVLFSGDLGFYSGAEKFRQELEEQSEFRVKSYPGISSVSYFAAKLGVSYQDAALSSIHGRTANVTETVHRNEKSFFLLSGVADVWKLIEMLQDSFPEEEVKQLELFLGYQLSYPMERIWKVDWEEAKNLTEEGLYVAYVKNPSYRKNSLTHGLCDGAFLREKVPMTKEEVREVSISKLRLGKDAVFYDIGSGTGSISIEAARISETIQVHAFEQKEEAVTLLKKNCEKFGLCNITVHHTKAPEGMEGLTPPTHAFVGGSGGNLKEVVAQLFEMNNVVRIVINAITLETVAEIMELEKHIPMKEKEILQLQISRAKEMGSYHLMQAENPIYIASFTLGE